MCECVTVLCGLKCGGVCVRECGLIGGVVVVWCFVCCVCGVCCCWWVGGCFSSGSCLFGFFFCCPSLSAVDIPVKTNLANVRIDSRGD